MTSAAKGLILLLLCGTAVAGAQPAIPPSEYQIELRFTGYSGLIDAYPDCRVNPQGFDLLVGNVIGIETSGADDDVVYRGTLTRTTGVDFCETKGRKGPGDDERIFCVVTLTGSAIMKVEIEVYGEADRGAYVQAEPDTGAATKNVSGDCDPVETLAIVNDYPSGQSGGSPSGQAINDAFSTVKFYAGNVARLRVGHFPPDPKVSHWALTVVRKVR